METEKKKTQDTNFSSDNLLSNDEKESKEAEILNLKKQVAANIWFQAIAQITEAMALTRLLFLGDQSIGEQKIVAGVWVQAIGQLIEAIGVSNQLFAPDLNSLYEAQRTAITGDWMQSFGAGIEATGGERVLYDAIQRDGTGFVP